MFINIDEEKIKVAEKMTSKDYLEKEIYIIVDNFLNNFLINHSEINEPINKIIKKYK